MTLLQEQLERSTGVKLSVRMNNNRSHMVSIRRRGGSIRLSLHNIFLSAPTNVMEALACYIRGGSKTLPPGVRHFIEMEMRKVNYTARVDQEKLITKGSFFDLEKLYNEINRLYFQEVLSLFITWYGDSTKRKRRSCNFGLYCAPEKLVKIHRLLDQRDVPEYVVSYIVYHEMLHAVCPPVVREARTTLIHPPEFKRREREFKQFTQASSWIKQNKWRFF